MGIQNRKFQEYSGENAFRSLDYSKRKDINSERTKSSDRRSGCDRRKSYSAKYFKAGGSERRNWKERRYLWFMTE